MKMESVSHVPDDKELIDRLKGGDAEAFDILYKKYSGKLFSFGMKYLRSSSEAEELVQSVYLKLWENYKNLNRELSFNSYLFTIAYNDICKLFRKRNYQKEFINDALNANEQTSYTPEDRISYQSVLERIQLIINDLPEKQKTIFVRQRIEGKSTKEIADEFKLSPGTVDNYISESLKFIRKHLHKDDLAMALAFFLFFM